MKSAGNRNFLELEFLKAVTGAQPFLAAQPRVDLFE
jgi:hypothetical protein